MISPDDVAAAVRAVPGVEDAAAVLRMSVVETAPDAAPAPAPDSRRPPADLHCGALPASGDAPRTLQEALRAAAEQAPDKGTVYITQDGPGTFQTYPRLLADAERVLTGLRAAGLRAGDAVLFQFTDNRAYLTAFWACVLGGFVPTPVAVAPTYRVANQVNRKLRNAWHLLDRPVLLTEAVTAEELAPVRRLWDEPGVRILTVEALGDHERDRDWFPATRDDPVLNLLTSGSTGVPKCVQHTHGTVTDRSLAVIAHCGLTEADVSLIWMPFDHVTVAFYNVRDVFLRCLHVNAKIEHFLADPLLWLDWAERYRATNTWAPNFAFGLVTERADEIRTRQWDLSCLREIVNAGEPVIAATSHAFLDLLAPHGLPADAIRPVWGMSETCSGVTYSRQSRDDRAAGTVTIDPGTLSGEIREVGPGHPGAVTLSAVGAPIPGVHVRVVDDTGGVLPEGRLGELWIRGVSMMREYFRNPAANEEARTGDGWFRTGDLAFVHGGEVVIAGRKKDQIIVRGVNYLAHEIESVIERVDGARVSFVAVAGIREPGAGSDRVVVFFVPAAGAAAGSFATAARDVAGREVGLVPDVFVPVTEAEFPKTGSGKIQRAALVEAFRAGRFTGREIATGAAAAVETPSGPALLRREWVEVPPPDGTPAAGVRLVLADDDELLCLGVKGAVVARRGASFAAEGTARYRVATGDRIEVRKLLEAVTATHGPIATVVFALPLSVPGRDPLERLTTLTAEFGALIGALDGGAFGHPLVLALTTGGVHVRAGDHVDLGVCALPGLVRTAVAEAAPLAIRQVDLPADHSGWAAAVRAELAGQIDGGVIALRPDGRRQAKLAPYPEPAAPAGPPVVPGGCYLVTGGLGGIAGELGGYLVAGYRVRLLLAGRSAAEGRRGELLAELRELGDVEYARVDVADTGALRAAVHAAETRWGRRLDGVLHLAGADPTGQWDDLEQHTIAGEEPRTYAAQYRGKVAGTLALGELLEDRPDAALILFGSVNGELGGHSFGAYAAANAFLVGFADHWRHVRGRNVQCLAWSMWSGTGMNRGRPTEPARHRGYRVLDPDEGLRLFLAARAVAEHYLVIGLDLSHPAMVQELAPDRRRASGLVVGYAGDRADPEAVRAAAESVAGRAVPIQVTAVQRIPRDATGRLDAAQLLLDSAPGRVPRTRVPPATDLERRLAVIWCDALDRPAIGRDDSFFDLGGNSLRATRLLALVRDKLAVRVRTQELYEHPTVAGMAATIARQETGQPR